MEALSYFIGGWYWEDIPRQNVVERVMFFPFAIATLVVGAPIFVVVAMLQMFIFPEDFFD